MFARFDFILILDDRLELLFYPLTPLSSETFIDLFFDLRPVAPRSEKGLLLCP